MTCDEFEIQLHEVLDNRQPLSDDPLLAGHAQGCGACHRKVQLYDCLFQGLELAEAPTLASEFSRATSHAAHLRRPSRWKRIAGVSMALAASLLAVVAVSNRIVHRSNANSPAPTLAEYPTSAPATAEQPHRNRPRIRHTPHSLAVIAPRTNPSPVALPTEESEISPPDLGNLFNQWQFASQGMSLAETSAATTRLPGFRPLATSLNTAFSALRQTLPGGRSESSAPEKPQAGMPTAADTHHA